jgi:hypothetical protein
MGSFADEEREPGHPSAKELVAYHTKELPDEACRALREHLVLCSECTDVLLDLANFEKLEPPRESHRLSDDDQAGLKRSIKSQLKEDEPIAGSASVTKPERGGEAPSRRPARYFIPPLYWGTLAALLLVAVGLGLREEQTVPGGTPELFHLYPVTYRSPTERIFQIPAWADSYVLILGSVGSDNHHAVRLELRDAEGSIFLEVDSLPRSGDGTFNHSLSRDRLPEGAYEIRLFGIDTEALEPLDSYTFQIALDASR